MQKRSSILSAFELLILALSDCFTKRSGRYVLALMLAWVLTPARKTLRKIFAHALVDRARSGLYRFFSEFKWDLADVARGVLQLALDFFGPQRVTLLLDDTLSPKSGPKIFGVNLHYVPYDFPLHMIWAHNWVIVALAIQVPLWKRWMALPLIADLYIREKSAAKAGIPFRTKHQIALELIEALTRNLGKPLLVAADGAYTVAPLIQPLKNRGILFVGRLKHTARLYQPLPVRRKKRRGRQPRWGRKLPQLSRRLRSFNFRKMTVDIYGETTTLWVAELQEVWPHAAGLIKVVIVKKHRRDPEPAYLMSTQTSMPAEQVIEAFSGRWGIEIAFRNAKSELGLGQARVRSKRAVLRVTNFCLWIQSLIILAWVQVKGFAAPTRPQLARSNSHKRTPSFTDMLLEIREQETRRRISRTFGPRSETAAKVLRFIRPLLEAI